MSGVGFATVVDRGAQALTNRYITFRLEMGVLKPVRVRNPRTTTTTGNSIGRSSLGAREAADLVSSAMIRAFQNSCPDRAGRTPQYSSSLERLRRRVLSTTKSSSLGTDWDLYREVHRQYKIELRASQRRAWRGYWEEVMNTPDAARLLRVLRSDTAGTLRVVRRIGGGYTAGPADIRQQLLTTSQGPPNRTQWGMLKPGVVLEAITPQGGVDTCRSCGDSRVVFISKAGKNNYTDPKSYRPVCLTGFIMKTMERLVDRCLKDWVELEALLKPTQHALEGDLGSGGLSVCVFADIERAFNNTGLYPICRAVERTQVGMVIVNWIHYMLTDQRLGGEQISIGLSRGCPQGGVLSPFL
ncbi:uncharacterized protein LOC132698646 [Cylas formicarius]|uniref:uncharacterized protein LOC132698646 n=1 Tax=Cylas formicarius TaxID=197179 RepID=UPI00295835BE|nr:uncharacterized protein LOC132698646 [Cylas formicarius]